MKSPLDYYENLELTPEAGPAEAMAAGDTPPVAVDTTVVAEMGETSLTRSAVHEAVHEAVTDAVQAAVSGAVAAAVAAAVKANVAANPQEAENRFRQKYLGLGPVGEEAAFGLQPDAASPDAVRVEVPRLVAMGTAGTQPALDASSSETDGAPASSAAPAMPEQAMQPECEFVAVPDLTGLADMPAAAGDVLAGEAVVSAPLADEAAEALFADVFEGESQSDDGEDRDADAAEDALFALTPSPLSDPSSDPSGASAEAGFVLAEVLDMAQAEGTGEPSEPELAAPELVVPEPVVPEPAMYAPDQSEPVAPEHPEPISEPAPQPEPAPLAVSVAPEVVPAATPVAAPAPEAVQPMVSAPAAEPAPQQSEPAPQHAEPATPPQGWGRSCAEVGPSQELLLRDEKNIQFVGFLVGDQMYAVPSIMIREVIRRQPLSRLPVHTRYVPGVINLRGVVIPQVSLRELLQAGAPQDGCYDQFSIITGAEGMRVGLSVDRIRSMYVIKQEDIVWNVAGLLGLDDDTIIGLFELDEKLVPILSVERVAAILLEEGLDLEALAAP